MRQSHEKFHKMSPKEAGIKADCAIQIARTTTQTGEQFVTEVPIYVEDTREQVNDRVGFFLSIMQDRMEDANKAMLEAAQRERDLYAAKNLVNQVKALEKRLQRGKITQEQFDEELAKLNAKAGKGLTLASEGSGEEVAEDSASGDQVKEG